MNAASNRDPCELPLVEELLPPPDPAAAFVRLARQPHVLFLDSAHRNRELGRYSFLAADPFDFWQVPADGSDALAELQRRWQPFHLLAVEDRRYAEVNDLPPFTGGAAGLLSYDLGRSLERVPLPRYDEFHCPALAMGLYDTVLAFDHQAQRAWIISQGFPETDRQTRRERAQTRIAQWKHWLQQPVTETPLHDESNGRLLEASDLAPSFSLPQLDGLSSDFTAEQYQLAVKQAIEYIYAGDIFQVNLSQRLLYQPVDSSPRLYQRLRERNPAPFMGYFDLGVTQIASASPERLMRIKNGLVETRPIKGTRPRKQHAVADLFTGDELQASEKDRAENVMIVDLLRNDLSRVCDPDSVRVTQLCGLETYEFVQHLVSAVKGKLATGRSAIDAIRAMFPGGSITGAPKVRAMEIISELEPTARGAYCGSLGYLGFDGTLDLSILIRTVICSQGWWQLPVGGGIVAASQPAQEYEETWHKATGLLRALRD